MRISARSRSVAPGEIVVLTITVPGRSDRARVHAFDHDIDAFASGAGTWRAIVGIDLDVVPGPYMLAIEAGGDLTASYALTVKPHQFPTRRLAVDPAFVNPPESERQRIERDTKRLNAVWQSSAAERLWTAPFVRPVPQPANSRFGTRSIFNGEARNPHGGADFPSPRHYGACAKCRPHRAGRVAVFFGEYRHRRSWAGTLFAARPLIDDGRPRRRSGGGGPDHRARRRNRARNRTAPALGGTRKRRPRRPDGAHCAARASLTPALPALPAPPALPRLRETAGGFERPAMGVTRRRFARARPIGG